MDKYKKAKKSMVWPVRITNEVQEMVNKLVKDGYNVSGIARDALVEVYKKVYGKTDKT